MALTSKLTAIADEIRGKTGLSDAITLDQMVLDIASIPTAAKDVPSYVQNEAERVAVAVKVLQSDSTVSFIGMSDVHIGSDSQSLASATHAAQAASIIKGRIPIDFTAVFGDLVTGGASDTLETHLANHMRELRALAVADPDVRMVGNHDANIYNADSYLTAEDTYKYIGRYNVKMTQPTENAERGYCYFDLSEKSLRVICLNSADLKDISASSPQDGHHISAAQFQWLVDALDMTGKSGWSVIVLSHHPLHWYGSMPNVLTILEAYIEGTSGSITADSTTVSFDFSGKNAAKLLGTFHGHTHNLIHGTVGDSEIVRIGTPNACFSRNNEYGSSSYGDSFRQKYGEVTTGSDGTLTTVTYAKTANSAKDTAFCVYTIDLANEIIYATCYGAGYDRLLSYSSTVYYSVASSLTNVTSSNAAAAIAEGETYTATLTASDGYELSSVTVTMGGEDITATAYSGGVVSIAEVTGNIVITAMATRVPTSYVVDIESVGYTEGARWSTSDGTIRTGATGSVAVNLIEFDRAAGETVTVELSGINWQYNANCTIALFADDTFKVGDYLNAENTNAHVGYSIVHGDNGAVTLTFYDNDQSAYDSINGFKVSGYGSASDVVITVTQSFSSDDSDTAGYTNLIDTVGYTDGYRLSTSTGELKDQDGYTTTGIIDISGTGGQEAVVRTKGVDFNTATRGYAAIASFNSSGTFLAATYLNTPFNGITTEFDENGNMTMTYSADGTASRYFKICGYGSGADLIVTLNEEIS